MNAKLKRQLDERYAVKQAINIWHGPQNPAFNSLIARVKSFEDADWPETYPTPISLADVGFFYDSSYLLFVISLTLNLTCYLFILLGFCLLQNGTNQACVSIATFVL